ncbi:UTP--glucose-1-phosphate uridylyltransferase GalU [Oligella ureolytica]
MGLGHAFFALSLSWEWPRLFADDLIDADVPVTQQLIDVAHAFGGSVLGTQIVEPAETEKYVSSLANHLMIRCVMWSRSSRSLIRRCAFKFGSCGSLYFKPEIFEHLRHTQKGAGNEIQLTDGIASMLQSRKVFGCDYEGVRYDCGSEEFFPCQYRFRSKVSRPDV